MMLNIVIGILKLWVGGWENPSGAALVNVLESETAAAAHAWNMPVNFLWKIRSKHKGKLLRKKKKIIISNSYPFQSGRVPA